MGDLGRTECVNASRAGLPDPELLCLQLLSLLTGASGRHVSRHGFLRGGFIYFWVWGVVEPLLALVLGFCVCVCLEFLFGFLSAAGPHLGFSPFLQKLPLL